MAKMRPRSVLGALQSMMCPVFIPHPSQKNLRIIAIRALLVIVVTGVKPTDQQEQQTPRSCDKLQAMRGMIIDYCGVLDGTDEDQARWRNLLVEARANGVGLAVLSNDPGGPSADPIRKLEDEGLVDAVVLSGEIGHEKPSAEAFNAAAAAIELPARDCVLVDDSIENIHAAVSNGMVGVFYQQFDRAVVEISGLLGLEGEF